MRKKEIITCGCTQCKAHTNWTKTMRRATTRKLRHVSKLNLTKLIDIETHTPELISTGFIG